MEIKYLSTLIAVVDTGSISAAAQRCNLTQGGVSHQIKAIENELGVKLFDRKPNEIAITEAGTAILRRARTIVREAQETRDELASMKGQLCGELRIGVGSFIEPYIRRAALLFMQRYPKVLLRVNFGSASILNKMLRSEELDLAFTMNTAYHNEGIESKPCIPFHLSCIMSKDNALAGKEVVTFEDLMQARVIMPDVGERVFQSVQRYTPFDLAKLPVTAIVSNPDAVCRVLDDLDAVTFLPSEYTESSQGLVAKPIKTLEMQLMSNSHWLKSRPLKASDKAFLECIEEVTK